MKRTSFKRVRAAGQIMIGLLLLSGCASVDKLLKQEKYIEAIEYCEKLKKNQSACFLCVADTFFNEKVYDQAFIYYERAGQKKYGARKIAEIYLDREHYKKALDYYEKAGMKQEGLEKIGSMLAGRQQYGPAIGFFQQAGLADRVNDCERRIAAALKNVNNGTTYYNALPEKSGFYLSEYDIFFNHINFGVRTVNIYSNDSDTLLQNTPAVFKNFELKNSGIELYYTWGNVLFALDIIDGGSKRLHNWPMPALSALDPQPSQNRVVTAFWDGSLEILNLQTGFPEGKFRVHESVLTSLDMDENEKYLAVGSADHTASVWDYRGWEKKTTVNHGKPVNQVALSADGEILVTCAKDRVIKMWSVKNGTLSHTLQEHYSHVNTIAVSPDNRFLVSGDYDGVVKIWNLKDGSLQRSFKAHDAAVAAVSIAPHSGFFASLGYDYTVKLWWLADKERFIDEYTAKL